MKKLLMAAFREHVMVLHVSVFIQSDGSLAASVKVPTQQDAQYAISQLHRRKVGFKRIMIAYGHSSSPPNLHNIKNQVASLLLEVPGHKMPLFAFRELFQSRYIHSVGVSDLFRMRDVCLITEEHNGRTISLNPEYRNTPSPALSEGSNNLDLPYCVRHYQPVGGDKGWAEQEQPTLPNVRIRLADLSQRVAALIKSHDNCLPLVSVMECYAAQFEPLMVDEQSVPLEHLLSCLSGVELVNSNGNKHLRLCPPKPAFDYKFDESSALTVSPSLANQVSLFARELVDLLKMQPHCQLLFNRFIPAYHHHFGRQCRVADYGFTKLMDLFEILPHVVQVIGEGSKRVVTLAHRAQVRRFTSDMLRVLKSQTGKQAIVISELPILFERALGRPFDPVDYGLCYVEDLLAELSANSVLITGQGQNITISIPKREQTPEEIERTKQFAVQVVELLSHTSQCSMEFSKFIPAYHHHFGVQCRVANFGFTKLIELFEALPEVVKVEDDSEGVRKVTLTLPEKLKVLANQMSELIQNQDPPGLPIEKVNSAYLWQFGFALKPSVFGCSDLMEVLNKLPTIKVITCNGSTFIAQVDHSQVRILQLRVLRVLWEHSNNNKMSMADFEKAYISLYNKPCNRHILETEMKNIVEILDEKIQLTPLQLFAHDVYNLLYASDGFLPVSYFESAFRRTYGSSVLPTQLGYSSTLSLLKAIDHVVTITNRGPRNIMILNVELAGAGISLPPDFLKTQNNNNISSHCVHSGPVKNGSHQVLNISSSSSNHSGPVKNGSHQVPNVSSSSNNSKHIDMPGFWPSPRPLQKGPLIKASSPSSPRLASPWRSLWSKRFPPLHGNVNCENSDQPIVINLPEPSTPPTKEECMALLSPATFLLPASSAFTYPFLPSPPHPSELPKPGQFNLTQVNNNNYGETGLVENYGNENGAANKNLHVVTSFSFSSPFQLKCKTRNNKIYTQQNLYPNAKN